VAEKTFKVGDEVKVVWKLESMLDEIQFRPVTCGIDALLACVHEAVQLVRVENVFRRECLQT